MLEFRAHASSSAGNLYTVAEAGATLAIECGLRIGTMRRALGYQIAGLDGVLISHHHGDHCEAARELARAGVDVYASAESLEALVLSGHRAHVLTPDVECSIGPWRVVPFELVHDTEGSLGFLIVAPGAGKLLYACDTAYVPPTFRGLTHIAIECSYSMALLRASEAPAPYKLRVMRHHMGLERVLHMLEANDLRAVREVWLLHLSDGHSNAEEFRRKVAEATGKPVYVAPRRREGI
jgi:phosphoribosyl 1,2-cyclic phosphodiesterase